MNMEFVDDQHGAHRCGRYGEGHRNETRSHSAVPLRIIKRITRIPISTEKNAYARSLLPVGSVNRRSTNCGLTQYSNPVAKKGATESAREEKITSAARALAR